VSLAACVHSRWKRSCTHTCCAAGAAVLCVIISACWQCLLGRGYLLIVTLDACSFVLVPDVPAGTGPSTNHCPHWRLQRSKTAGDTDTAACGQHECHQPGSSHSAAVSAAEQASRGIRNLLATVLATCAR
jgi:hypothetical protein